MSFMSPLGLIFGFFRQTYLVRESVVQSGRECPSFDVSSFQDQNEDSSLRVMYVLFYGLYCCIFYYLRFTHGP